MPEGVRFARCHGCHGELPYPPAHPLTMYHPCCTVEDMNTTDLLTTPITDLSAEGTVTHVNAIGDDVEVWLSVPTDEGTQHIIRRIPCQTPEQAQSVARLWKAVWC